MGRRAFEIVTSTTFEIFIGGAVVLSLILMSLTWYHEPHGIAIWNSLTNYFFLCLFTGEMCIKLLGIGKQQYFASGWNVFDFALVNTWLFAELGAPPFHHAIVYPSSAPVASPSSVRAFDDECSVCAPRRRASCPLHPPPVLGASPPTSSTALPH